MDVLVLGAADLFRALPLADCMEALEEAFLALGRGEAVVPPRSSLVTPDRRGALAWMPAWLGPGPALGLKAVTVFGRNRGGPHPSHQGAVLLFDPATGQTLAIADGAAVTEVRTAAASALATRLLACPEAGDLALLGSGTQAAAHLTAMGAVRALRRVRVWSRTPEHARRFALAHSVPGAPPVEVMATAREAVAGADLICTVTAAREPVLAGDWLAPGAHVNAVGASVPPYRELDSGAVARSALWVDSRAAALAEADDVRVPLREGRIGPDHVRGDLAELLAGRAPGRSGPGEVTVFKSVGLGLEDVAALRRAFETAGRRGIGVRLPFGARREP